MIISSFGQRKLIIKEIFDKKLIENDDLVSNKIYQMIRVDGRYVINHVNFTIAI